MICDGRGIEIAVQLAHISSIVFACEINDIFFFFAQSLFFSTGY